MPPIIRGLPVAGNMVPQVDNINNAFNRFIAWHAAGAPMPFTTWLLRAGLGINTLNSANGVRNTLQEFGLFALPAAALPGWGLPAGMAARQAHLTAQFPAPPAGPVGWAAMPKKLVACYLVGHYNAVIAGTLADPGNINLWLAANGFSGNPNYAANNLKGPGQHVGHFFGLLNGGGMPTPFFVGFF